jgi:hypothetical protein
MSTEHLDPKEEHATLTPKKTKQIPTHQELHKKHTQQYYKT